MKKDKKERPKYHGKAMCERCMGYFSRLRIVRLNGQIEVMCSKCAVKFLKIERAIQEM